MQEPGAEPVPAGRRLPHQCLPAAAMRDEPVGLAEAAKRRDLVRPDRPPEGLSGGVGEIRRREAGPPGLEEGEAGFVDLVVAVRQGIVEEPGRRAAIARDRPALDPQILAQGRERLALRRVPAGHRPTFWRRNASGLRRSVNPNGTVDP